MKYQHLLDEKGIQFSDLSSSLQNKIIKQKKNQEKLEQLKAEGVADEIKAEVEEFENALAELDKDIENKIKKFDLEAHKKKIEQLAAVREKKVEDYWKSKGRENANGDDNSGDKKSGEEVSGAQEPNPAPAPAPEPAPEPAPQPSVPEPAPAPEVVAAAVTDDVPTPKPSRVQRHEMVEEFEKQEEVHKPKKGSLNFILIGAGAFLLTWGAVNLFKERR